MSLKLATLSALLLSALATPSHAQFGPNSPEFSTPVALTLESSTVWIMAEADVEPKQKRFRLFAMENDGFKNVAILTCTSGKTIASLELVPPDGMKSALQRRYQPNERPGEIYVAVQQSTTVFPALIDNIAAFVYLAPQHIPLMLGLLDTAQSKIFFDDKAFGYGLTPTLSATRQVRSMIARPDIVQQKGTAEQILLPGVIQGCIRLLAPS